jgi:hypothetical protein
VGEGINFFPLKLKMKSSMKMELFCFLVLFGKKAIENHFFNVILIFYYHKKKGFMTFLRFIYLYNNLCSEYHEKLFYCELPELPSNTIIFIDNKDYKQIETNATLSYIYK